MANLTYTVIKNEEQYNEYCNKLEQLLSSGLDSQEKIDEYELLQLLISDWEEKHRETPELDPVELVKSLKEDHGLNQTDLGEIAGVGRSYISEILNYKKRMSKKVIRNIADHFSIRQEVLNKPYRLEGEKSDSEDDPKTSKVISITTGNQVNWDEDREEYESPYYPQTELEYAKVN